MPQIQILMMSTPRILPRTPIARWRPPGYTRSSQPQEHCMAFPQGLGAQTRGLQVWKTASGDDEWHDSPITMLQLAGLLQKPTGLEAVRRFLGFFATHWTPNSPVLLFFPSERLKAFMKEVRRDPYLLSMEAPRFSFSRDGAKGSR